MPKLIKHNKNKKTNKNKSGKKYSQSKNSKKTQQHRKLYGKTSKIAKQRKRLSKLKLVGGSDGVLPKDIKHFWYQSWPDKGVPAEINLEKFKVFINNLIEDITTNRGGTVIHCSAGVGRTGTVYVILKLLLGKGINDINTINTKGIITYEEIKEAIIEARKHRMYLVQTYVQLEFICNLFLCGEALSKDFEDTKKDPTFQQQKDIYDPKNKISDKDFFNINITPKEFNMVQEINKPEYYANVHTKECNNKDKNRFTNILPYSYSGVFLPETKDTKCSDYINANYLNTVAIPPNPDMNVLPNNDPFKGIVIATQCPKLNTQQDFLRMLAMEKHNIKRIIMVTNLKEQGRPKCDDYTTDGTLTNGGGKYENEQNYESLTQLKLYKDGETYKLEERVTQLKNQSLEVSPITPSSIPIQSPVGSASSTSTGRLEYFINHRKYFSACDCRIMLLFILVYDLISGKKDIFQLIKNNVIDSIVFISKTMNLLNIPNNKLRRSCKVREDANSKGEITKTIYPALSDYLSETLIYNTKHKDTEPEGNKQQYMKLFGVSSDKEFNQITQKLSTIFDNQGNYLGPEDYSSLTPKFFQVENENDILQL